MPSVLKQGTNTAASIRRARIAGVFAAIAAVLNLPLGVVAFFVITVVSARLGTPRWERVVYALVTASLFTLLLLGLQTGESGGLEIVRH